MVLVHACNLEYGDGLQLFTRVFLPSRNLMVQDVEVLGKVVANLFPLGLDVHTSAEGCLLGMVAQARPQCGLAVHATHDRRDHLLNVGGLVGDSGLDVFPHVQEWPGHGWS